MSPQSRCSASAQQLLAALDQAFDVSEPNSTTGSGTLLEASTAASAANATAAVSLDPGVSQAQSASTVNTSSNTKQLPDSQMPEASSSSSSHGKRSHNITSPIIIAGNSGSVQFLGQRGYIDFGLAGSQESQASCQPDCAFTNPSASYGLTVLPLNPNEDLNAKLQNSSTPQYVKDNLDGRYGDRMAPTWQLQQDEVVVVAGCTPPIEASR